MCACRSRRRLRARHLAAGLLCASAPRARGAIRHDRRRFAVARRDAEHFAGRPRGFLEPPGCDELAGLLETASHCRFGGARTIAKTSRRLVARITGEHGLCLPLGAFVVFALERRQRLLQDVTRRGLGWSGHRCSSRWRQWLCAATRHPDGEDRDAQCQNRNDDEAGREGTFTGRGRRRRNGAGRGVGV